MTRPHTHAQTIARTSPQALRWAEGAAHRRAIDEGTAFVGVCAEPSGRPRKGPRPAPTQHGPPLRSHADEVLFARLELVRRAMDRESAARHAARRERRALDRLLTDLRLDSTDLPDADAVAHGGTPDRDLGFERPRPAPVAGHIARADHNARDRAVSRLVHDRSPARQAR